MWGFKAKEVKEEKETSSFPVDGMRLGFNAHGKGRVRMVKVTRKADGTHEVAQLSVQILLEGDNMSNVFMSGSNATVVATDTCKNTVYCLGKMHDFQSIEEFGLIICRHFLSEYAQIVNRISVEIVKDRWERIEALDSLGKTTAHKHAFVRVGPNRPFAHVQGEKRPGSLLQLSVQAGFTNLEIMKTTQSGFVGFHRDRFTSLPEVEDRLLGTSITAEWAYNKSSITTGNTDFNAVSEAVKRALVQAFAGPADVGVYSSSVQQTLYDMGKSALHTVPQISQITLEMPNIHNIPFNLEPYGFPKDKGAPTIFFPIDEPHGMIKAVVERSSPRYAPIKSRL